MAFAVAIGIGGISATGTCGNHMLGFVRGNQYPHKGSVFQMAGMYCDNSYEIWGSGTYWLTEDGFKRRTGFIAVLDSSGPWKGIKLRNTHNGHYQDRSTKEFNLYLGDSPHGSWNQILKDYVLVDNRKKDPPPQKIINFDSGSELGKYVRFDVIDYYGSGGGLQYFNMIKA